MASAKEMHDRAHSRFPKTMAALTPSYFICGEGGEKDINGLPERISVCPAYGADHSEIYVRFPLTLVQDSLAEFSAKYCRGRVVRVGMVQDMARALGLKLSIRLEDQ